MRFRRMERILPSSSPIFLSCRKPKTTPVYIFDRWQNEVWRGTNYDNTTVVFKGVSTSGTDLPTGTLFLQGLILPVANHHKPIHILKALRP